MTPAASRHFTGIGVKAISLSFILFLSSCDRNSSPEGRMSIKLENLQKEMIDSLQKQNKAILDSIGKIREELNELRQQVR
jgi:nucleoside-triphosphatase THEP1